MEWLKHVDGHDIFPKLPVYLRMHHTMWQHNQSVKDAVKSAACGVDRLKAINRAMGPAPLDTPPGLASTCPSQPVQQHPTMPRPSASMPQPPPPVVGGATIGGAPIQQPDKRRNGERGSDTRKRKARRCGVCIRNNYCGCTTKEEKKKCSCAYPCKGRHRAFECEFFSEGGTAKSNI